MMNFEAGEVLLINKPLRWTSFDVVNKLRYAVSRKYGKRLKVGHAGTLDPLATGLLVICTGKMTKRIDEFTGMDKEYTGTLCLGATTVSYDSEFEPNALYPTEHITEALLQQAALLFNGTIAQVPPVFSAIKKDGVTAYQAARKGKEMEMQARPVTIHHFEITANRMPLIDFKVTCSKGTYIRSLAYDFGRAVNSGAYLAALCRTRVGNFDINDALTIEQALEKIEAANV